MLIGDINLIIFIFFIILWTIAMNTTTTLNLLLTAEILWVTLFALTLLIGLVNDNLNILALTFFFLVLSAIELGIGLVILLLQNLLSRSTNLFNDKSNIKKFLYRMKIKLYINKLNWKV